jgi:cell wall-associated NlpC family hydrolase
MREGNVQISRRAFIGGAAVFGLASLSPWARPLDAFAVPTAAEKQAEADQVRTQVETLKAELVEKSNLYGAALDAHDEAVEAMGQAQAGINVTSAKIASLQNRLGTRVRSMYRNGSSTFFDIILAATSFEEFVMNWDILNKMNDDDAAMVAEAKVLREELEEVKNEYARQEKLAAEKMEEARVAKEETEAAAEHYQGLLDTLDAEVLELILQEQEAAAAAAAAAEILRQGGRGSGADGGGRAPNTATDFGPPAGDILSEATKYLGLPYVWGGSDPSIGFDCSGLVWYCCMRTGRTIPPRTTYGYGGGWFPVSEAQPGDVLWQPEHVGICAAPGGTSYLHAANEQYGICWGSSPQFTRAYRF